MAPTGDEPRGKPGPRPAIEPHLDLVDAIAHKVKRTVSPRIDLDDLVAYGRKGLLEAASRFDERHGVPFTTFAYYRIRGAMFDGIRTMGWFSRGDYARWRAEEAANNYLASEADREGAARAAGAGVPTPAQNLESIGNLLAGLATIHLASIDAAAGVIDASLPEPDDTIDSGRASQRLRAAVAHLPDKERRLVEAYYFGGKTLDEAGRSLGMSKSWASRLHSRAIDQLRQALAGEAPP